ncbi:Eco57I restriction-modification methylase domain-containing protein [Pontibacter virosus]|uniref:site-specific DNA-methyltransferase (adenine-specific) n=2 Tax=Pontibacter TaxID=323449 RepID=A0A5C8IMY4_9BACT|nr:TaqI-like C-terminal specificity domain-containing protein [Pontibacter virosus]PVY38390.1 N-6 DNA methylase [Pontibacter virosus]TXK22527.1 N-6 DNA methylase [Pontibacter qinzhouensis]
MAQLYSPIFSRKYLKSKAQNFHLSQFPDLAKKRALIEKWQSGIKSGKILKQKEEELQSEFLNIFFGEVLEYVYSPEATRWNLSKEHKSDSDSTKADGALGYFWMFGNERKADVRAVIELKDARTDLDKPQNRLHDKRSPVEQAFSYVPKAGGNCRWVLVSNFLEIRLYHHSDQSRYEQFDVMQLHEEAELLRFLFQVHKDRLILEHGESATEQLYRERQAEEHKITKNFYGDYKKARLDLFRHLHSQNPEVPELTIFQKTQKLLDRVVFVCFCEDLTIIPPYTFRGLLKAVKEDKFNRQDTRIYERVKDLFFAIDQGYPEEGINKFNGGLFAPDTLLDNLQIKDSTLEHIISLEKYDFASDLNVNILGHIFEQSISDIEETKAEIAGHDFEAKAGKRKKDGIFYTPEYITRYIVKEAVGGWLQDRQRELGFEKLPELTESDYASIRFDAKKKLVTNKAVEKHLKAWDAYREALRNIKVLDPACGSGAFLNQVFDFLFQEGQRVNKELARLRGGQFEAFDLDRHILNNNIFGVDLNEESVEITKLSLWLKTANKSKELTTLDANIKCGNSLVSDPAIAGEKAFDWQQEFPDIFKLGGFDVIVGNPPYGILIGKEDQRHFIEHFPNTKYKTNLYVLFLERMFQVFDKGVVHFIIPKSLLFNSYYESIRKHLIERSEINEIFTIAEKVFEDAEVGGSLLLRFTIMENPDPSNMVRLASVETTENFITSLDIKENSLPQSFFLSVPNCEISVVSADSQSILQKLNKLSTIKAYYTLKNGLNPGNVKHILISEHPETDKHRPIIWGKDISKYRIEWSGEYINYDSSLGDRISLEEIKSKDGMNKQNRIDFALRTPDLFERKKIVIRKTGDSLIACVDRGSYYFDTLVHGIYQEKEEFNLDYLVALLNSRPATLFYRLLHDIKGKVFAKISLDNLASFPIPEGTPTEREQLATKARNAAEQTQELFTLSQKFLKLLSSELGVSKPSKKLEKWYELTWEEFAKELVKLKVKLSLAQKADWLSYFEAQQKAAAQILQQRQRLDDEIDQMVFQLYGLTKEEIELIYD